MAFAIMGGLLVASLLTLVFLPTLYVTWFERRGTRRRRRLEKTGSRRPRRIGRDDRSVRFCGRDAAAVAAMALGDSSLSWVILSVDGARAILFLCVRRAPAAAPDQPLRLLPPGDIRPAAPAPYSVSPCGSSASRSSPEPMSRAAALSTPGCR